MLRKTIAAGIIRGGQDKHVGKARIRQNAPGDKLLANLPNVKVEGGLKPKTMTLTLKIKG